MFFICDDFRTVLATRHVAIKDIPEEFQNKFKKSTISNSVAAMKKIFNIENPKIAISGLKSSLWREWTYRHEEIIGVF